jgi:hypothetical protein
MESYFKEVIKTVLPHVLFKFSIWDYIRKQQ